MMTIILLSRNTSQYLRRVLTYYKTVEFKGRIFIADSSSLEERTQMHLIVKEFRSDLFCPIIFEYDHSTLFSDKIVHVIQKVCTTYVLLASVDDFFSFETLREGMDFLKRHTDYAFVSGYSYGYTYQNDAEIDWYYTGDYYYPRSFFQDDSLVRINSYLEQYTSTIHSLFRTTTLISVLQQSALYANDPCGKFYENMVTILALLSGKGKFLKVPYAWREQRQSSAGNYYHEKWLLDENFEKHEQLMELGIKNALEVGLRFDSAKAAFKSKDIMQKFIEYNFNSIFPRQQKLSAKQSIKQYIPAIVWNGLKFFKNKKISIKRVQWSGEHLMYDVISPYYREFELVKKLIKDSNIYAYRSGLDDIKIPRNRA